MHQLNLLSYVNNSNSTTKHKPKSTKNASANTSIFKDKSLNKRKDSILKSGNLSPCAELKSEYSLKNKFTQFTQKGSTVNVEQFKKMKFDTKPTNLRNIHTRQTLKQEIFSPIKTNNTSLFNSYNNNKKLTNIFQQAQNQVTQQSNLKYILTNNLRKNPQKNRSPRNKEVSLSLLPKFSEKETNLKTETSLNTNKEASNSVILTKSLEHMNTTHMNSTSIHIVLTEPNLDPRDIIIEKLNSKINDLEGKLKDLQEKVSDGKPGNILITSYEDQVYMKTDQGEKGNMYKGKSFNNSIFKNENPNEEANDSIENFYDTHMITSPGSKKNRIISISKIETIRSKLYKSDTQSTQLNMNMNNVNKNVGVNVNTSNLSQSIKKNENFINNTNKRNNNNNIYKLSPNNPHNQQIQHNQLSPSRQYNHFHTKPCSFKNSLEMSLEKESNTNDKYPNTNTKSITSNCNNFLARQNFKSVNVSPRKFDRKNFLFNEMNIMNISQERERKRDESIYIEEDSEVSFILSNKFYQEKLNSIKEKTKSLLNKFSQENSRLLGICNKEKKNLQNVGNVGNNNFVNILKTSQPHTHTHSKSYLM
jgi:hypothetical protein